MCIKRRLEIYYFFWLQQTNSQLTGFESLGEGRGVGYGVEVNEVSGLKERHEVKAFLTHWICRNWQISWTGGNHDAGGLFAVAAFAYGASFGKNGVTVLNNATRREPVNKIS